MWEKFSSKGRENHPVINVTWNDAAVFAEWAVKGLPLNSKCKLGVVHPQIRIVTRSTIKILMSL